MDILINELSLNGQFVSTPDFIDKGLKPFIAVLYELDRNNTADIYEYNGNNIYGSSLAESYERDKVVISFIHSDFSTNILNVSKNGTVISIDNLFDSGHYLSVAKSKGIIIPFSLKDKTRFNKTTLIFQGQSIYQEASTNYYWYLDNFHKKHYEVFNNTKQPLF